MVRIWIRSTDDEICMFSRCNLMEKSRLLTIIIWFQYKRDERGPPIKIVLLFFAPHMNVFRNHTYNVINYFYTSQQKCIIIYLHLYCVLNYKKRINQNVK